MSEDPLMSAPPPSSGAPAPRWKVSFADLLSVLICFFVLLLSVHSMTKEQLRVLADAFAKRIQVSRTDTRLPDRSVRVTRDPGVNLDYLGSVIGTTFGAWESLKSLPVTRIDDRLGIMLPYDRLFTPQGTLTGSPREGLFPDLASALKNFDNQIQVLVMVPSRDSGELAIAIEVAGITAREIRAAGYTNDIPVVAGYSREQIGATRSLAIVVLPTAVTERSSVR